MVKSVFSLVKKASRFHHLINKYKEKLVETSLMLLLDGKEKKLTHIFFLLIDFTL